VAQRILIGNRSTGGYGLYVSKSGADVTSCGKNDLYFWTENEESGGNFVGLGISQTVPISGGSSGVPVESASINISSSSTASVSFQDLVVDGDDIMVHGGVAHPITKGAITAGLGIKFTSLSATGATANRTYSGQGGTFTVCAFKLLGDGAALY